MAHSFATNRRPFGIPIFTALALASALGGCGSSSNSKEEVPLSAMTNPDAHTSTQVAAVRRTWQAVEAGELDHAAARESLKRVAWARARWEGVRRAAIETLLEDEAQIADTRNMLRLMLPTETQWGIITFICDTAAERGWKDLTAAIVRSWSRPVPEPPDSERPERHALERLYPGTPPEDVVFGVFTGVDISAADFRERDRRDAWTLLRRIDPHGTRTLALLTSNEDPSSDPWVLSLRACAIDLRCVPETGEELLWINQLREPEHRDFWASASSAIAGLTPEQQDRLALRHAAAIVWAAQHRPQWLGMTQAELLEAATAEQKSRKKHVRAADRSGGVIVSELLSGWRDTLSWGDALTVMIGFELATAPGVAETLFTQVEQDRRDTTTEHGGVMDGAPDGFALRGYIPRPSQRYGDRQFVAPAEMISESPESVFHYHFHVQRSRNSDYAGPSGEDIDYAYRFGRSCIVFTSITEDVLDADLYHGSGVIIDLGEIRRPSASR
jgi:hypothetical protein